jgi:hypothetical protein
VIPNLTMIVAAYTIIRLLDMANRPLTGAPARWWSQIVIQVLAVLAAIFIVLCSLDTLGTGLSLGTSIEAQREHNRQDFNRRSP